MNLTFCVVRCWLRYDLKHARCYLAYIFQVALKALVFCRYLPKIKHRLRTTAFERSRSSLPDRRKQLGPKSASLLEHSAFPFDFRSSLQLVYLKDPVIMTQRSEGLNASFKPSSSTSLGVLQQCRLLLQLNNVSQSRPTIIFEATRRRVTPKLSQRNAAWTSGGKAASWQLLFEIERSLYIKDWSRIFARDIKMFKVFTVIFFNVLIPWLQANSQILENRSWSENFFHLFACV